MLLVEYQIRGVTILFERVEKEVDIIGSDYYHVDRSSSGPMLILLVPEELLSCDLKTVFLSFLCRMQTFDSLLNSLKLCACNYFIHLMTAFFFFFFASSSL